LGECCNLLQWGQPPTILVHFEDLKTLLMKSNMCIVLCTWFVVPCPSLPQQSSQNFVYSVSPKIIVPPFRRNPLLAPGSICSMPLMRRYWISNSCMTEQKPILILGTSVQRMVRVGNYWEVLTPHSGKSMANTHPHSPSGNALGFYLTQNSFCTRNYKCKTILLANGQQCVCIWQHYNLIFND